MSRTAVAIADTELLREGAALDTIGAVLRHRDVYKILLETEFTAAEANKSMQFALKVGGAVTPATK